jgi:hypothetical protein
MSGLIEMLAKYDLENLQSAQDNKSYWKSVSESGSDGDKVYANQVLASMSESNSKPDPHPLVDEQVIKLSAGIPGAIRVLSNVPSKYWTVFEQHNITGSKIWCMFKDLCGQKIDTMIDVLQMLQGGKEPVDLEVDGRKFLDCVK